MKPENALTAYIRESDRWTEIEAMNLLCDYSIVNQGAIWSKDVHEDDCPLAIAFLERLVEREGRGYRISRRYSSRAS